MAYDGTLKFDTSMDTSGFQKDTNSLNSLVKGLGVFELLKAGFNAVAESVGAAVSRYDTLNKFPKVLEMMGYSGEEAAAATKKLSDGVQGLPTTLDGIISNAQRLTVLTGNLELATDTTLALNNAFLASGASSEDAERGLTQYVQQLSKGKPDMQSWRTLQETMGYALNKTAEAFGFAGESAQVDLYAALRDGHITFKEFNAKIIELNEGVGGFAEMAKTATGGIGTAWTNMKTSIVRGTEGIIRKIDEGLSETKFKSIEGFILSMKDGINASLGLVAEAFGTVASNADWLVPALVAIGATIAAWRISSVLIGIVQGFQTAALQVGLYSLSVGGAITADALQTAALTAKEIIVGVLTGKISLATAAQYVWNAAVSANPIGLLVAGIVALAGVLVVLSAALGKSGAAFRDEKARVQELAKAHKEYAAQVESSAEAAEAARIKKLAEIEANKTVAQSLNELIEANNAAGDNNYAIAASVEQLNGSMEGLGLAYDSVTGKLNMTSAELETYITNLAAVETHQLAQEEHVRLLGEQAALQRKLNEATAAAADYQARYNGEADLGNLTHKQARELWIDNQRLADEYAASLEVVTAQTDAASKAVIDSYDTQAEQSVRATQIRNNEMDSVREYAKMYGMTAEAIIGSASRMAGGLEEWSARAARLYTSTGESIGDLAAKYRVSVDEINAYLDANGATLDEYAAHMESMHTDAGLSLADLATKWGTTTAAIEAAMLANEQTAQEWEDAQIEALDAVREYAIAAGESYESIEAAAKAAGMSIDDYVASQKSSLTESGMDIQQVADYWGVSVSVIEGHMDRWKVSLDQAHNDMAAMRTAEGQTLDQLATKYGMTSNAVKAAAAAMGTTWQEWGNTMDATVNALAETYGVAAAQIIAESQNMTGGLEAWATQAELQHQRALVAEQDYIAQIKAGAVEIDDAYAQSLEARRVNGEQLNAVEQASLEQWKSINQAAVEAYKAQQQQIIDASKAKANEIKVAEQQSAEEVLRIQAANNAATAQYVQNYNTIWGQIPPSQRQYLSELDIDSAKFLADMVAKWDEGGKEQWETYVAGIEEGKTTASEKAGEAAEEVGDTFVEGTESKEPEVKQAGTDMADATGEGMKDSTAPSEASQEIADNVIKDLTSADYSGITTAIATAITAGTGGVVTAAATMCASVTTEFGTMGVQATVTTAQMMTAVNASIVSNTGTVKASTTTLSTGVQTVMTEMQTKSISTTEQMMTGVNSAIVTRTGTVKSSITSLSNGVTTTLTEMKTKGTSLTEQMMTGINSAITSRAGTVTSSATALVNGVASALNTMVSKGKSAAEQMMAGMLSAMNAKAPALYAKAQEIANRIAETIRKALDVQSPSRVMIEIFEYVMMGIYKGMEGMEGMLYREAESIADGLAERLTISPDVLRDMVHQLRAVTEANPFGNASLVPQMAGAAPGGVNYNTSLTQNITTPKPLSASEMTREGQDLLRRQRWQLP